VKKLEKMGKEADEVVAKKKAAQAGKLVKGFDSERNLPGAQNLEFDNAEQPVFAGDLDKQKKEHDRKTKLKAKARAKKKSQMAAENGEEEEEPKKKRKSRKSKEEKETFVSVKGASKKGSESYAMKHKELTKGMGPAGST
jgi:hypothetical protein